MYSVLKRLLIGSPLASEALGEQRLNKRVALAVFGTDAIASTAFASQEILVVLVPVAGMAALDYLVPISLVVIALLAIVTASYRQTLYAYPSGGGSYIVSRENLGTGTSLVAAAALMVDYTLTVSVSIAAGVAAITSAIAPLRGHEVALVARSARTDRGGEPARGARVGPALRAADVPVHRDDDVARRVGPAPRRARRPRAAPRGSSGAESLHGRAGGARGRVVVPVVARVLVGRGCAERCRGDLERRPGVPQARVAQRRDHADRGRDDPRQRCSSASPCSPRICVRR